MHRFRRHQLSKEPPKIGYFGAEFNNTLVHSILSVTIGTNRFSDATEIRSLYKGLILLMLSANVAR